MSIWCSFWEFHNCWLPQVSDLWVRPTQCWCWSLCSGRCCSQPFRGSNLTWLGKKKPRREKFIRKEVENPEDEGSETYFCLLFFLWWFDVIFGWGHIRPIGLAHNSSTVWERHVGRRFVAGLPSECVGRSVKGSIHQGSSEHVREETGFQHSTSHHHHHHHHQQQQQRIYQHQHQQASMMCGMFNVNCVGPIHPPASRGNTLTAHRTLRNAARTGMGLLKQAVERLCWESLNGIAIVV